MTPPKKKATFTMFIRRESPSINIDIGINFYWSYSPATVLEDCANAGGYDTFPNARYDSSSNQYILHDEFLEKKYCVEYYSYQKKIALSKKKLVRLPNLYPLVCRTSYLYRYRSSSSYAEIPNRHINRWLATVPDEAPTTGYPSNRNFHWRIRMQSCMVTVKILGHCGVRY